jgi:hypothetical protein
MNLKKLGNVEPQTPASLATCLDFVSMWGSEPDRATLGRLCAGAIGICTDHAAILPKYKPMDHTPSGYGYIIMERLLAAGVTPGDIYTHGTECLVSMAKLIPTEAEVENKANF